jgi:hypothetical protein
VNLVSKEKYLDNNGDDCGGADICKCTKPGRLQPAYAGLKNRLLPPLCFSLLVQFFPSTLLFENRLFLFWQDSLLYSV